MLKSTRKYNTRKATKSDVPSSVNDENVVDNFAPAKSGIKRKARTDYEKNSKKTTGLTKSNKVNDIPKLTDDSLYLAIKEDEKKKQTEQRKKKKLDNDKLKAVKNVEISTPNNNDKRKNAKSNKVRNALYVDISPIKMNESMGSIKESTSFDSLLLMRKRQLEKEEALKTPEPSYIKETREFIKGLQSNKSSDLVQNSFNISYTSDKDTTIHNDQQQVVINIVPSDSLPQESLRTEVVIPSKDTKETSLQIPAIEESNDSDSLKIPEIRLSTSNLEESLGNELNQTLDEDKQKSIADEKRRCVHFASLDDTTEKESDKTLEELSEIRLKPGKWRKSLIAWRKSHNFIRVNKTSRNITALFPIKSDNVLIKRYAEKLQETLINPALLEQSDEGSLHELDSDSSIECASFHESYVPIRKNSKREASVIKRSSIFYGILSPLINPVDVLPNLSARQIVLRRCGQQEPLLFDDIYSESKLPNCNKIGEGVYGEVFMYKPPNDVPIVLKIIPIEGELLVNGEPQKRFDEILSEIVISMELSDLRDGKENATDGFVKVKRVTCVKGAYPQHLLDEWQIYNDSSLKGSENDNPEIFEEDQLYVVFELCNAGLDLEAFQFKNAEESFSVFLQVALTLAVAENKFEFEHRDLHWGNVLVSRTLEKFNEYRLDGKVVKLPTNGVKATIIDFTLSRMLYDDAVLYDNLAKDEELFSAHGDYQFDIYRLMRYRVKNDFKRFEPYTNLLWLHYLIDKLIDGARYKYSKSDKHKSAVHKLMQLRDILLVEYQSAFNYASSLKI